jgi:hypothetical protein
MWKGNGKREGECHHSYLSESESNSKPPNVLHILVPNRYLVKLIWLFQKPDSLESAKFVLGVPTRVSKSKSKFSFIDAGGDTFLQLLGSCVSQITSAVGIHLHNFWCFYWLLILTPSLVKLNTLIDGEGLKQQVKEQTYAGLQRVGMGLFAFEK